MPLPVNKKFDSSIGGHIAQGIVGIANRVFVNGLPVVGTGESYINSTHAGTVVDHTPFAMGPIFLNVFVGNTIIFTEGSGLSCGDISISVGSTVFVGT